MISENLEDGLSGNYALDVGLLEMTATQRYDSDYIFSMNAPLKQQN